MKTIHQDREFCSVPRQGSPVIIWLCVELRLSKWAERVFKWLDSRLDAAIAVSWLAAL